jgi:serine/threonine-protein kinase RsbW/sigma-B regulation protein RsbU (phosphoserine phosphatase)
VRHGGCAGKENAVRVRLQLQGDGVHVDYSDHGDAFDPLDVQPPELDVPLEERQVGGLGIHLIRQIMQDLEYHREGEWNRITMRRPS